MDREYLSLDKMACLVAKGAFMIYFTMLSLDTVE